MKKGAELLLALGAFLLLSACNGGGQGSRELIQVGRTLGLHLTGGTLVYFEDSHGGFHGDGQTVAEIAIDGLAAELAQAEGWHALPMTGNAARAIYGDGESGPLSHRENGDGLFPEIGQGCYYFYDYHSQSEEPYDDTELYGRASWNFTVAAYDSEHGRLYFYQLDT